MPKKRCLSIGLKQVTQRQKLRLNKTKSSVEIIGAAANGFESGFSGFTGLTITSLDAREDYYYMVHPFPGFPPMHYASAKRRVKSNPLQITNTSKTKT
jgi:hypothetical protein